MMKAVHWMMASALIGAGLAGCSADQPAAEQPVEDNAAAAGPATLAEKAAGNGKILFLRCSACHALESDAGNKVGPNLAGVIGRKAGSVEGFAYSEPMKASGLTWTREELDRFIENPMKAVPGTKMAFAGIPDAAQREAVIDYIAAAQTEGRAQ